MLRSETLVTTDELTIRRFDHPPGEHHHDPDVEHASDWAIVFVRAGGFVVSVGRSRRNLVPGSVLVTHPGMAFQCRHLTTCPDDVCLSIAFDESALAGRTDAWMFRPWTMRTTATPRLALAQHRLSRATAVRESFAMERWALAALEAMADESARGMSRGPYRAAPQDLEAVVLTCRAIEADPAAPRQIADRAREVGMTTARLTHAFRRHVGRSPHRYVIEQRLVLAAGRLQSGDSVSAAALASGFGNLSHFCRSFHAALRVRPSAWRAQSPSESRRKVQDMLRGHR